MFIPKRPKISGKHIFLYMNAARDWILSCFIFSWPFMIQHVRQSHRPSRHITGSRSTNSGPKNRVKNIQTNDEISWNIPKLFQVVYHCSFFRPNTYCSIWAGFTERVHMDPRNGSTPIALTARNPRYPSYIAQHERHRKEKVPTSEVVSSGFLFGRNSAA